MDLYSFQRLPDCPLTLGRIRFITRQILDACCYLHSNHVMHRDLKPDNILICCSTGVIKVADFGYARTFSHVITPTACLFKYSFPVQVCVMKLLYLNTSLSTLLNRFHIPIYHQAPSYKAPEILLGCDRYSSAIDVWSIG